MAKMAKIKKKTADNPYLLKGEEALLLAEACKLDKQRKDTEKRLKEIKASFKMKEKGEYFNSAGDTVILSFRDKYTDMNPKEVQKLLKSKKLGKYFWKCVKIALTETKKYLTEKEIDDLRTKLDPIKAFSFK